MGEYAGKAKLNVASMLNDVRRIMATILIGHNPSKSLIKLCAKS